MLGMEASGHAVTKSIRKTLMDTISLFRNIPVRQA
jgi:hypothetical protein